jgi:hypothetical protein
MSNRLERLTDWPERAVQANWCVQTLAKQCDSSVSTLVRYIQMRFGACPSPFPRLIRCHTCKQGNETPGTPYVTSGCYNCLAWCIGDTTGWWWKQASTSGSSETVSAAEMTTFLNSKGIAGGTIAYFGANTNVLQHVARKSGGSGSDCQASSKLGHYIRISHDLHELEGGSVYYDIVGGN